METNHVSTIDPLDHKDLETLLLQLLTPALKVSRLSEYGIVVRGNGYGLLVELPNGGEWALQILRRQFPIRICSMPECEELVEARGLCNFHYIRWKRKKAMEERRKLPKKPHRVCLICGGEHLARNMCSRHYQQWKAGKIAEPASSV